MEAKQVVFSGGNDDKDRPVLFLPSFIQFAGLGTARKRTVYFSPAGIVDGRAIRERGIWFFQGEMMTRGIRRLIFHNVYRPRHVSEKNSFFSSTKIKVGRVSTRRKIWFSLKKD